MGRIFSHSKDRQTGSPIAVHVGNRILKLRQRDNVTMREVAKVSGLSNAFVCQLENGQSSPSADTLWKLANYFKVSVNYFFVGLEEL